MKPEVAKPTLTKAESGEIEPPKTETDAPESTPGPDLTKPAKTVADEPKAPATPETGAGESATTPTQSKAGWRLVAILGAAAVIVAILAGIAFFKVGAKTDDIAWVDEGATAEVLRVTPSALAAVFTFSPDTFDADFDKGVQGLNQSMRDQLTQYKDTQKAGVEQTQTATTADVPLIGITRLEEGPGAVARPTERQLDAERCGGRLSLRNGHRESGEAGRKLADLGDSRPVARRFATSSTCAPARRSGSTHDVGPDFSYVTPLLATLPVAVFECASRMFECCDTRSRP
ncbi:hypothetical protein ACQGFI_08765 [Rhodococcus sp. 2.95]